MIILSIDPGNVSGVGVWDSVLPDNIETLEVPYTDTGDFVWGFLYDKASRIEMVVERYTMTGGIKTSQPDALKLMGVLEWMAAFKQVPLHYYLPSTSKKTADNKRLRRVGWYKATKDGHANDGARLVLTHLANRYPEIFGKIVGL